MFCADTDQHQSYAAADLADGLEYVASAAKAAGLEVDILDLGLVDDPDKAAAGLLRPTAPSGGLSFRNVDDCFWPSAQSFVPDLGSDHRGPARSDRRPDRDRRRSASRSPPSESSSTPARTSASVATANRRLLHCTARLHGAAPIGSRSGPDLWRKAGLCQPACLAGRCRVPAGRDSVDNAAYFRRGGQIGLETKRGCNRQCIYCADPAGQGTDLAAAAASEVADEVEALAAPGHRRAPHLRRGVQYPTPHAEAVCEEFIRRGLGRRVRWYAYLAVTPFDADLADSHAQGRVRGHQLHHRCRLPGDARGLSPAPYEGGDRRGRPALPGQRYGRDDGHAPGRARARRPRPSPRPSRS